MSDDAIRFDATPARHEWAARLKTELTIWPHMTAREVVLECLLGVAACCLAGCGGFFLAIGETVLASVFGAIAVLIIVYHAATVRLDDADDAFTPEDRE